MLRFRRSTPDVRLEMTPLIDVVFLLLTFFVFAVVLMVRVDILDVALPAVGAGERAERGPVVTIVLARDGVITVDGQPVTTNDVGREVSTRLEAEPDARLIIAVDEQSTAGTLIELADRLTAAGISGFSVVGRPDAPAAERQAPGE